MQAYAADYANQNEFWNGALIDNDTSHANAQTYPDQQFMMTARTSRFGFATITPTAGLATSPPRSSWTSPCITASPP